MLNGQLMSRDLQLLQWVNTFGCVTINQMCRWLAVGRSTAYDRLRKLAYRNFLYHERIFHNQPGVYRLSREGVRVSQSPLPALVRIPIGTFQHDLKVVDLSLALCGRWGGRFVSERQLRHQLGRSGVGNSGHVNDGLFILPDKKVAIEVELTEKGWARLENIFEHHYQNTDVDETWYFCGDDKIKRRITPLAEKVNFIRVYPLNEFIGA